MCQSGTEMEEGFTVLRTVLENGAHVQHTKEALSPLRSSSILVVGGWYEYSSSASTKSRRRSKPEQGWIRSFREGKVILLDCWRGNFWNFCDPNEPESQHCKRKGNEAHCSSSVCRLNSIYYCASCCASGRRRPAAWRLYLTCSFHQI